jgi:hypothetical protein
MSELARAAHKAYYDNQTAAARNRQRVDQIERRGGGDGGYGGVYDGGGGGGGGDQFAGGNGRSSADGETGVDRDPPASDNLTPAARARERKARAREAEIEKQKAALASARLATYQEKKKILRRVSQDGAPLINQEYSRPSKGLAAAQPSRGSPTRGLSTDDGRGPSRSPRLAAKQSRHSQASRSADFGATQTLPKPDGGDIAALEMQIETDVAKLVAGRGGYRK